MTTSATIYGTPSKKQETEMIFEHIWIQGVCWVNFCKVKERLCFEPSDIDQDLSECIAIALGVRPHLVRIDCEVKYKVVKPITVEV